MIPDTLEDPLAGGRGMVLGMLLGAAIWGAVVVTWAVVR